MSGRRLVGVLRNSVLGEVCCWTFRLVTVTVTP